MKKTKFSIYILSLLFIVTSCYELDRYPLDKPSSGTFWKNESQVHQGLMGVYQSLKQDWVFGFKWMMDSNTDIGVGYDWQSYRILDQGTMTTTDGIVLRRWQGCYEGIAQANNFIMNVSMMTEEQIDTDLKEAYLGEVRFLRAVFYFELLNYFGGVPIYDETTDVAKEFNDMLKPRNTAEEVREFVLEDIDAAIATLPTKQEGAESGRVAQSAGYALKGKVLLYNKEYSSALTNLLKVTDSEYGHILNDSYSDLFLPSGDESPEIIFAIQNMGGLGQDNGMKFGQYLGTRSSYGSCWNNSMPSTELVNMYEYKDGSELVWDDVFPGFNDNDDVKRKVFESELSEDLTKVVSYPTEIDKLKTLYANLDPRCEATIITPYSNYLGWYSNAEKMMEWVLAQGTKESNGFIRHNRGWYSNLWRKFVPTGNMNGAINSRAHVPINFPMIRLADVYLMIAECYNQEGKQVEAADYINNVRSRASVAMPAIKETSKEDIFKRIIKERAIELAGEGHRYDDLRRWRVADEYLNSEAQELTGEKLYDRVFNEREYLWPIPHTEIEMNPTLEQNPGWQ